jgi:hypothetical protein
VSKLRPTGCFACKKMCSWIPRPCNISIRNGNFAGRAFSNETSCPRNPPCKGLIFQGPVPSWTWVTPWPWARLGSGSWVHLGSLCVLGPGSWAPLGLWVLGHTLALGSLGLAWSTWVLGPPGAGPPWSVGPLGHWAQLGPWPSWTMTSLRPWAPLGPRAHLGSGAIWTLSPLGPRAHLGPGPTGAPGPLGPWAHLVPFGVSEPTSSIVVFVL